MQIDDITLDVVLAVNVKGDCNKKKYISQKYSLDWITAYSVIFFIFSYFISLLKAYKISGNPGYLNGNYVNVLWNDLVKKQIYFHQSGFYLNGRNAEGRCNLIENNPNSTLTISPPLINSFYDSPIVFGKDFIYSCTEIFTISSFTNYCVYNFWKNLELFKAFDTMDFIGKFGSSDIKFSEVFNLIILFK